MKRYVELDSLRGIAAIMVLLSHYLFIFPLGNELNAKLGGFISVFWNGHSAVIVFFLLSGFVLSLPFFKVRKPKYSNYIIKRVCRIYIPYISVIAFAIGIKSFMYNKLEVLPGIVEWGKWNIKLSFSSIIKHVLFLGEYDHTSILMVLWSLVHEMRISIIFPLVVVFLIKIEWKKAIGLALFTSFISFILVKIFPTQYNLAITTNYFITLHYITFQCL